MSGFKVSCQTCGPLNFKTKNRVRDKKRVKESFYNILVHHVASLCMTISVLPCQAINIKV